MKIDVFTSEICGSYYQLRENIEKALAELHVETEVNSRTVYYDDAVGLGIKGSPSVWINGKDAFAGGNAPGLT